MQVQDYMCTPNLGSLSPSPDVAVQWVMELPAGQEPGLLGPEMVSFPLQEGAIQGALHCSAVCGGD